jgi:hypothetical protein
VSMEVSAVDLCLGVLPVAQLGLHAFFSHHSYRPPETSELERLATDVKFGRKGLFYPAALNEFRGAFGAALGAGEDINHVALYQLLLVAIVRDSTLRGAGELSIAIDGAKVSWYEFAHTSHIKWEADVAGFNGGSKRLPTLAELGALVDRARDFATARMKSPFASPLVVAPHPDGYTARPQFGATLHRGAARPPPAPQRVAAPCSPLVARGRGDGRIGKSSSVQPALAFACRPTSPRRR